MSQNRRGDDADSDARGPLAVIIVGIIAFVLFNIAGGGIQ